MIIAWLKAELAEKNKKTWMPFAVSLLLTPVCLLLAIASAGAGHGDYFWAKIIYPYTMLSTLVFNSITVPFRLLAVAQLPIYGVFLSITWVRKRLGLAALALLAIHAAAALACFAVRLKNF
jgi:hypothetical protein